MEDLRAALAATKRERAEAVLLHDVLGHDLMEIARMTGVSIAAAQSRLVRGRKDVVNRMISAERTGERRREPNARLRTKVIRIVRTVESCRHRATTGGRF